MITILRQVWQKLTIWRGVVHFLWFCTLVTWWLSVSCIHLTIKEKTHFTIFIPLAITCLQNPLFCWHIFTFPLQFVGDKRKGEGSDAVVWQTPLNDRSCKKKLHKSVIKTLDCTTKTDQLRMPHGATTIIQPMWLISKWINTMTELVDVHVQAKSKRTTVEKVNLCLFLHRRI